MASRRSFTVAATEPEYYLLLLLNDNQDIDERMLTLEENQHPALKNMGDVCVRVLSSDQFMALLPPVLTPLTDDHSHVLVATSYVDNAYSFAKS